MPKEKLDLLDVLATIYIMIGVFSLMGGVVFGLAWAEITKFIETIGFITSVMNLSQSAFITMTVLGAVIYWITGYLLYKREDKILATILSILMLFVFPIGTVIALLTFYVLYINPIGKEIKQITI